MKKWISILMTVALMVTTIFPAASHASMHQPATAKASIAADDHHDGHHHHDLKVASAEQGEKPCCDHAGKKPCCGHGKMCCKDMCKCPGGNCNGGLAKIFNNSSDSLLLASSEAVFGFGDEFVDPAFTSRLKRPPKA